MKIALLTNSKLSIPAIDFLAKQKLLVAIGLPDRENKTEDADHIQFTASHHGVPVTLFARQGIAQTLGQWISDSNADVVFVLTFPFKIPGAVLKLPPKGFINFHFGILPQYRGADAIFWQIRNGEKEGGISVHQMTGSIDRGPLFLVHKVPLSIADTYGSHMANLSGASVTVAQKIVQLLQTQQPALTEQDENLAGYYSRPLLADVVINWNNTAKEIIAMVNATNPWNKGAVSFLNQYPVKIISVSVVEGTDTAWAAVKPGTILTADKKSGCRVLCGSEELLTLDILFCNDSFMTGIQFASLGIMPGMQFDKLPETSVA